jgi:hypothetical protein
MAILCDQNNACANNAMPKNSRLTETKMAGQSQQQGGNAAPTPNQQ